MNKRLPTTLLTTKTYAPGFQHIIEQARKPGSTHLPFQLESKTSFPSSLPRAFAGGHCPAGRLLSPS
jgi:hypothetical protein